MNNLATIFQAENGEVRLRNLRFFLVNKKETFKFEDIEFNTKSKKVPLRKDLNALLKAGFLEKVSLSKNSTAYRFDNSFKYANSLYDLVFDFQALDKNLIVNRFKKIGRLKLFSFTGVFIDDQDIELDILIVGDNLKPKEIQKAVSEMDSIFASKLRILIMDIEEFDYRKKMFDRFLHIVLESNRTTLIDKLSDRVI